MVVAGKTRKHPEGYALDVFRTSGGGEVKLATVYAGSKEDLETRAAAVVAAFQLGEQQEDRP